MMVAKIGDTVVGVCTCASPPYPDVGVIVGGNMQMFNTGPAVARLGDPVSFSCGMGSIVSGAFDFISGGQPLARMGDSVTGCGNGTIVSSSRMLAL